MRTTDDDRLARPAPSLASGGCALTAALARSRAKLRRRISRLFGRLSTHARSLGRVWQEQQAKQKAEMRLMAVPGLLPVHDPSRPDEGMAD